MRGERGTAYNVGSAEEISIAELARRVVEVVAPGAEIHMAQAAAPGTPAARYVPDIERAGRELGLRAWIPLDEAIRRTHAWHLQARFAGR
jgi:dTDP-glucose 4,6-dehydratase